MNNSYITNSNIVNIAYALTNTAKIHPYKKGIICISGKDKTGRTLYSQLTFQQLDKESDSIAHGLQKAGITRGIRTILMVKPCLEFFTITFALFKIGAVPVVVDPGMGIKRMVRCLQGSDANAFIGIPKAHILRIFYPKFFNSVKTWVTVGKRWFWRGLTLKHINKEKYQPFPIAETREDETAAILFTTGSTGPAKGVVYTHGNFAAQIKHIKSHFNITIDEIDLPTFPLFALFDPALGMTAVIPEMDPTKPAYVDPQNIIEPIIDHGVTNMFASPALLNQVGKYGKQNSIKLESLKRVVSAGAPVSPENIDQFSSMLSDSAQIHTPYGATEAVPITSIASNEILSETRKFTEQGYGVCIGLPINDLEIRIIQITDQPIEKWSDHLVVNDQEIGEICVKGDLVTRTYFKNSKAYSLAKIQDQHEKHQTWHRMGDLGWKDRKGRIWFCGRKNHRVITKKYTLYTIPCEAVFNNHPNVFRSALVGIGQEREKIPVICIELKKGNIDKKKIKTELLSMARANILTQDIYNILFCKSFPVDIRHNAKIFREQLVIWAEKKLGVKNK